MLANALLAAFDPWSWYLPESAALAAVALIGYVFGHRTRRNESTESDQASEEWKRAKRVARELEQIAEKVRRELAAHRASVDHFKDRIERLGTLQGGSTWNELCAEAEQILEPTLKLATQITLAYDEIRQQSNQLIGFAELRTDSLTGVANRRGLDESLEKQFAAMTRSDRVFSLVLFDIDHFKQINDDHGHSHGDRMLQSIARLLEETVRETDFVARYGGEEFVIVMPQTPLAGACIFCQRLRHLVAANLPLTISGGIAVAGREDDAQSLLSRADSALYSAKANGRNAIFKHDGKEILPAGAPAEPPIILTDADSLDAPALGPA